MLLSVNEVARYLVLGNREIRIHPLPGSSEADIRTFLLGSVLGALLHTRQMLVLHASAIQTERGAVVFMGRSGAGKSTLLGAFLQSGYSMLADDKAGICLTGDGVVRAMPGLPLIRLTEAAAEKLRYPVQGGQKRQRLDKYVVPVEQFSKNPITVRAAYSLVAHNQQYIRLEPLDTLASFQALNRYTYMRRFVEMTEGRQSHFRILSEASRQVRVTRALRPAHPFLIEELRAQIEEDMAR
jgi:hypothetical protein